MLGQYQIAALSETRVRRRSVHLLLLLHWEGEDDTRTSGVGLAIRTSLARELGSLPRGISDRLMTLRIRIGKDQYEMIISAYAPTMTNPEDAKEAFLEELSSLLTKVSHKDKVFLLGDFNGLRHYLA